MDLKKKKKKRRVLVIVRCIITVNTLKATCWSVVFATLRSQKTCFSSSTDKKINTDVST